MLLATAVVIAALTAASAQQGPTPYPMPPEIPAPQDQPYPGIIKLAVDFRQFIQEHQQGRDIPLAISKIREFLSKRLVWSDLECGIERLACSHDNEVIIEHQQLLPHGMADGHGLVIWF